MKKEGFRWLPTLSRRALHYIDGLCHKSDVKSVYIYKGYDMWVRLNCRGKGEREWWTRGTSEEGSLSLFVCEFSTKRVQVRINLKLVFRDFQQLKLNIRMQMFVLGSFRSLIQDEQFFVVCAVLVVIEEIDEREEKIWINVFIRSSRETIGFSTEKIKLHAMQSSRQAASLLPFRLRTTCQLLPFVNHLFGCYTIRLVLCVYQSLQ